MQLDRILDWRSKPRKPAERRLAKSITFRVNNALYEEIENEADSLGVGIAETVRRIVERHYR